MTVQTVFVQELRALESQAWIPVERINLLLMMFGDIRYSGHFLEKNQWHAALLRIYKLYARAF
jgi:hypothetical protein